jgi:hypothetical protein
MAVDYEALLRKYIDHVGWEEGTTFLSDWRRRGPVSFTDEEWIELQRLDDGAKG